MVRGRCDSGLFGRLFGRVEQYGAHANHTTRLDLLVRAVVSQYDRCCRLLLLLGPFDQPLARVLFRRARLLLVVVDGHRRRVADASLERLNSLFQIPKPHTHLCLAACLCCLVVLTLGLNQTQADYLNFQNKFIHISLNCFSLSLFSCVYVEIERDNLFDCKIMKRSNARVVLQLQVTDPAISVHVYVYFSCTFSCICAEIERHLIFILL